MVMLLLAAQVVSLKYVVKTEFTIPDADSLRIAWVYELSLTPSKTGVTYVRKTISNAVDGADMPLSPGTAPLKWEAVVKPGFAPDHGRGLADFSELRLQRLVDFVGPVNLRDNSWRVKFPEIPVNRAPAALAEYQFLRLDGKDRMFRVVFKEQGLDRPMVATGEAKVAQDGTLRRLTLDAKDAPVAGSDSLALYHVEMTRE